MSVFPTEAELRSQLGVSTHTEEAPSLDAAAAVDVVNEIWFYGPPDTAPRESNYISDENLLVWLAQKEEGLYGELRDHMDVSRARGKLIEDLNHLKGEIDNGASPEDVAKEMRKLLGAYDGTAFEGELEELFRPTLDTLEAVRPADTPGLELAEKAASDMSEAINSKVEALGRDDQLELVEIQSLTADIREAAQLASNLISSSNQTANTIVGNIAR